MTYHNKLPPEIRQLMEEKAGGNLNQLKLPPPVFHAMQGEFLSVDLAKKCLRCRFPVLPDDLNPFGHLQGGMISAAIDNTIGPLSLLVAAPSVTRRMEVKYSKPVTIDCGFIWVTAQYAGEKKRFLSFAAVVENESGSTRYATAHCTHIRIN